MYYTALKNKASNAATLIYRAIKGEQLDYTQGSLRTAILMLAIPMILEMGMESVFAVVDLFFVSRIGKHAVSTVGLTESVLTLVYSMAIGLSMAATATVARRIGEKNKEAASQAALQAIWLGIVVTIIVSVIGMSFAPDILRLMGAEAQTIRDGTVYTRIMMGSSLAIVFLFLINGIFRGAGDASIAMKSLWIANLCNIILCPLLINGVGGITGLGLKGAAIATVIGRSLGVCYQLYHLFKGKGQVKLSLKRLQLDLPIIKSLVGIGWPATMQFIIGSCSWIFLAHLVAETGHSAASAGYQTAIRILMFFLLPAWGISNAASTLVGQNLGAKEYRRAERAVIETAKYNAVFMLIVSVLFFVLAEPIVRIFSRVEEVTEIATLALRIISSGYIFYGVGMVVVNAFNGAGDTKTPTMLNIFCFWLFQVPMAYLLARYFAMGPTGVFIIIPISETLMTITAILLFRRGKWKLVQV
jgi:putative MATE family efflux protein